MTKRLMLLFLVMALVLAGCGGGRVVGKRTALNRQGIVNITSYYVTLETCNDRGECSQTEIKVSKSQYDNINVGGFYNLP